ncbi:VACV-Cop G ORF A [Yokapox virus]|uniref:VACV-Cop G ORF A n=1 Tax=Yokapox virus TaxID=1076255 RepID=G3EIE2_9POXV|nr:VACV-Cop G ORF A [Yokapox virus]AEN03653.1 VACV-Cop G ORF A [Yokapox virus]
MRYYLGRFIIFNGELICTTTPLDFPDSFFFLILFAITLIIYKYSNIVNFCISDPDIGINVAMFPLFVMGLDTAPSVLYPLIYCFPISNNLEYSII